MRKNLLNTLLIAAIAAPTFAMAEEAAPAPENTFTGNVALVSDYLYRGISQTGAHPALQGGFDYAHSSGLYAGVWGSSITWLSDAGVATNAGLELDTYAGFKNTFAEDFSYDVGFLRYNYPGNYVANAVKGDTNEVYGSLGYKFLSAKYSYSLGDTFGVPDAKGTNYLELNANYTIADTGITLGAHAGKQTYKGNSAAFVAATAAGTPTYTDYKLSVSKDVGGYVFGLAYSNTNAVAGGFYQSLQGRQLGKSTAVVSLSHAM